MFSARKNPWALTTCLFLSLYLRIMSLFVSSLNSGSNGNCYYVGNQDEAVLIDGGISRKETEKRMKRLGLSIRKVKGVFVSHEHGDHIHGVAALCKKFKIPAFLTEATRLSMHLDIDDSLIRIIKSHEPVQLETMAVTGFPKQHDASDPHSFVVESNEVRVGVFTDLGAACKNVINHFRTCHAAFLETNYDEDMLTNGRYPHYLKERIRGDKGHLSNVQALQLFMEHRPPYMTHLFLSHISKDNNRPSLVKELFNGMAGGTEIVVASRRKETPIFHIRNLVPRRMPVPVAATAPAQLQLF